ncbi:MAG: T9SS type A sorting domain-containing protein [Bacteroidales bacterium]
MADFSVYPNPFEDYTNVSFNLNESSYVELSVYNIVGEVVYQDQYSEMGTGSQKLLLDTQDYKPGIYFINLLVGDKIYTKKITAF